MKPLNEKFEGVLFYHAIHDECYEEHPGKTQQEISKG